MPDTGTSLHSINERLNKHQHDIAETRHGLINAKEVFTIKLGQVATSIEELKNILKWAGGLIITLMISFMSWSALQQYNANESQKKELAQQIELMQNQERDAAERAEMLEQLRKDLGTSGAVTPVTPDSRR